MRIISLASAAAVLAISLDPAWAEPPPSDRVIIDVITVNGSGCKPGTVSVAVAPDNSAFTLTHGEYMARVGGGAVPTDSRKNCQLSLRVHAPAGYTFGIQSYDLRGFASLVQGAGAMLKSAFSFQGDSPAPFESWSFVGPFEDDVQVHFAPATVVYKPCGEVRNLNLNTDVRVNRGTSAPGTSSLFSLDSADGSKVQTYHLAWKRCP